MRKQSLVTQILAVNALLIVSTTLAGIAAARLSIGDQVEQQQALIIVIGILAALLVNGFVLRRRFSGLDGLINLMEDVDLSRPGLRADVAAADTSDVARLCASFNRMLARVEDERARTGSAVLEGQEQERARLARDLHDECNQALTGILLRLEALSQRTDAETRQELQTIKELTARAMDELLRLARELRPTALDDHGLRVAMQAQIERVATTTGMIAQLLLDDGTAAALDSLTEQEQIVVYRIVQEAMSNVAQHANASRVDVHVRLDPARGPVVTITDDGDGIRDNPDEGLGLIGMRERARLVGAEFSIAAAGTKGTTATLRLNVPVHQRTARRAR
jgi:two-component system sensor histidine kinase UhpB